VDDSNRAGINDAVKNFVPIATDALTWMLG
jgi:hypothetical protein